MFILQSPNGRWYAVRTKGSQEPEWFGKESYFETRLLLEQVVKASGDTLVEPDFTFDDVVENHAPDCSYRTKGELCDCHKNQ